MAVISTMKECALSTLDKARSLDNMLRMETYGGKWDDEVGHSYLSYVQSLVKAADRFVAIADDLQGIENSLLSLNEEADRAKLEKLRAVL